MKSTSLQIITDNDTGHLRMGREISRSRKKQDVNNEEHRNTCKQKLSSGDYNPMNFLKVISYIIGNMKSQEYISSSDSEYSDEEKIEPTGEINKCVICLAPHTETWIFMPCTHAYCCTECSQTNEEL